MNNDVLVATKTIAEMGDFSESHWYDIQNPKSPRFDPSVPKKVRLSSRMVRYWRSEVLAWLESKRAKGCGNEA